MRETTITILAIEDELSIRRFLKSSLVVSGYNFVEASTAQQGLELAQEHKPNVILLDLGLPDMDGIQVIQALRAWTAIPIIVISARDQERDKIKALDMGADDYLTKPFSVGELNARVRVALRHAERITESETPLISCGKLQIDLLNRSVILNDEKMSLTPIQFAILSALARRVNKIVTHKQLLKEVWGEDHAHDIEYLRIYVHQLRHKIEENPAHPQFLKTEPGVGYRLVSELKM